MRLISKKRGSGKTTMLIATSAATGYPIVVTSRIQVPYIMAMAEEKGYEIPEPLVARDLHDRRAFAENVLIDEGYQLIETAIKNELGGANPIAITYTPPEFTKRVRVGILR
jgi:hypothetical protein